MRRGQWLSQFPFPGELGASGNQAVSQFLERRRSRNRRLSLLCGHHFVCVTKFESYKRSSDQLLLPPSQEGELCTCWRRPCALGEAETPTQQVSVLDEPPVEQDTEAAGGALGVGSWEGPRPASQQRGTLGAHSV